MSKNKSIKTIGFNFTKNDLRYCVLSSPVQQPTIIEKNKIIYPRGIDIPELMEWFDTQLSLLISNHELYKICYKITLHLPTLDQIKYSCYPQAILNLIAKKKKIDVSCFSSSSINATKFGLPQKTDVFNHLDSTIGIHKPFWDKATKEAVLVAWFGLI